mmetsp:Transcript_19709/g.49469  ORF Transcript_19709/g.49469 Transcript_19709/m.49469 type:complete len:758 (+) Transcript_19709:83-2356(+)
MAPHQSRPLQERRPRVPGEVLYFLAAWKEKLGTQELRYPTAAKNRQNARDQFAERDELEDETLLQLLFGSAVEIVTAVGYLGKLIVTEVADAAVTISWWLFEKILSVLEWMCELRSRGGSFFTGKHPLSGNIFAFFVALMAGMLYCAFLEYSKIVYAHELLRQSINVSHFKLVFHVLLSMTVSAYLKGVVTGPGFVSDDKAQFRRWRTELHAMQVQHERKKKMYSRAEVQALNAEIAAAGAVSGDPDRLPGITEAGRLARVRFCQKEFLFKPDRAHHCRVLGKNVLRMDHHCPWILNTVGLRNQKFFYLFLLYGTLAVDYLNGHLLHLLVTLLNGSGGASDWISLVGGSGGSFVSGASLWTALQGVPTSSLLVVTQGAVLSSLLAMAMNPFLVVHTYFMCKNMTTLEFFEQRGGGGSRSVAGSTSALKKSGKVNAKVEREGASGSPQESRPRAGGGSRGVVDDFLMTVREDEDGGEEALSDEPTSDPENNPYDLGIYENVAQVMGTKNFLLWLLPFVSSYAEDADLQKVGYTYPRNDDDQTAEDKEDRPHVGTSSSAAGAQGTKKTANPSSHVARRKISEGAAARKGVVTQPPPRPLFYGEGGVDPDVSVNLYQTHDPYQSGEEEELSSQNMNASSLHTSNSSQHGRAGQSDQRSQYLLDSLGHGDSSRLAGSTSSQLSFLDLSKEEQRTTVQRFLFTRAAGEGGKGKKKKRRENWKGGEASSEESMGFTKLRSWVATAVDDVATGAEYFWEAVMAF